MYVILITGLFQGEQIMDYKKKKNIAKLIAGVSIAGTLTGGIIMGETFINPPKEPARLVVELSKTGIFMDDGEHTKYVDQKARQLYTQLRSGIISSEQFSAEYDYLTSEQGKIDYARNSNNPQIQKVVTKYDKDTETFAKDSKADSTQYFLGGTLTALSLTSTVAGFMVAHDLNESDKEEKERELGA